MENRIPSGAVFFENGSWSHKIKYIKDNFSIDYKSKGGFSSRKEAEASFISNDEIYQKNIQRIKQMTDIRYTFTEYLDYWYQSIYLPYSCGSGKAGTAWTIYRIIFPSLTRDLLINRIDSDYLNEMFDNCQKMCSSAAPMAKKILNIAMKDAVQDNIIKTNPVSGTKPYPWNIPKITILSQKEIKILLEETSKSPSVYLDVLLALLCGLRKGEIRGLKYEDFDYQAQTVTISRQYCRENEVTVQNHMDFKLSSIERYIKPPKTVNAYRTLKIPSVIFRELEKRKAYNKKIFDKWPEKKSLYGDYVCIGPSGNITSDSTVSAALKRICLRAGITKHITVHGLRHMFCTILLEQNVPLEEISKMMGHSRPETTFDLYCGIMDAQGSIRDTISDYMDPISYKKEIE